MSRPSSTVSRLYPLSKIYLLNPLSPIFIHLQTALFGGDVFFWDHYLLSLVVAVAVLVIGHRVFNRAARTFLDTI